MVPQNKGKIFLADERGHNELPWFRSYNTFNFGAYQHKHKTPFGPLLLLNDDTLAGGETLHMAVEEDAEVLLLPIVGVITYSDSLGHVTTIEAGECQVFAAAAGTRYQVGNPYEEELVNFLQVWIKRPAPGITTWPQVHSFNLDNNKNQVIQLNSSAAAYKYCIGKYGGREESMYTLSDPGNGLFVFVIEGAFEVQYRLLHARDGLALWEAGEVAWEALSNDAILFTMEFNLTHPARFGC